MQSWEINSRMAKEKCSLRRELLERVSKWLFRDSKIQTIMTMVENATRADPPQNNRLCPFEMTIWKDNNNVHPALWFKRIASLEKNPYDMCASQMLRACNIQISLLIDLSILQNLYFFHEAKDRINLCVSSGWSEPSLFSYGILGGSRVTRLISIDVHRTTTPDADVQVFYFCNHLLYAP